MVKSKTKIDKQLQKKKNSHLVETIINLKKKNWIEVASILSGSKRKQVEMNVGDIDALAKEGEKVLVPGKVLSQGNVNKKFEVVAVKFSEKAKEKLLNAGCKISYIKDEINSNPEAKGLRVLKK